jgi:hypothetical protein
MDEPELNRALGIKHNSRAMLWQKKPPTHQREEAMQRLANGEAQADIARSYAVSRSTISRLAPGPFGEGADASMAVG